MLSFMVLIRLEANTCRFKSRAWYSLAKFESVLISCSLFFWVMNLEACTVSTSSLSSGS